MAIADVQSVSEQVLPDGLAQLAALTREVARELDGVEPFELGLGPAGLFPSARRPRVVALEVVPEEPLAGLAVAVERGVVAAGFPAEPRRFRAHLTLGRVRGRRFPPTQELAPAPAPFAVREAVLFRSELGRGGSRYTPLERIPLAEPR